MLECIAIITKNQGSLSTVVGDEKLTSREGRIGPLFMHVQSDEDTLLKVDEVSKTEAQAFDVFDQLISSFLVHFGCIACV
jgi:hypothetical protein